MGRMVELEDHSELFRKQNEDLVIDPAKTAVVTIDLHNGHLDPVQATVPVGAELSARVVRGAHDVLVFAREHGLPVVHVTVTLRRIEAETKKAAQARDRRDREREREKKDDSDVELYDNVACTD